MELIKTPKVSHQIPLIHLNSCFTFFGGRVDIVERGVDAVATARTTRSFVLTTVVRTVAVFSFFAHAFTMEYVQPAANHFVQLKRITSSPSMYVRIKSWLLNGDEAGAPEEIRGNCVNQKVRVLFVSHF